VTDSFSGNNRYVRVCWREGIKKQCSGGNWQFSELSVTISYKPLEIRATKISHNNDMVIYVIPHWLSTDYPD